jgi:predicted CopG family antitoxin
MVKTLTIKDSTYRSLVALKGKDESFSDLLDRLAERRGVELLRRLRGTMDLDPGEREAMLADIRVKRKERRFA